MTKYTFPSDNSSVTYGISTRDFIAIMAMQGLCANPDCGSISYEDITVMAYKQADAMIKESEK